jgi:regulator of nucleoside diphosphate kinase
MDCNAIIVITENDHRRLQRPTGSVGARLVAPSLGALDDELGRADVVPSEAVPATMATMSTVVQPHDRDSGEELPVTLVFPPDADASVRRILVLAPIGLALLGSGAGDSLDWPTPPRTHRPRIGRNPYPPVAAGQLDR